MRFYSLSLTDCPPNLAPRDTSNPNEHWLIPEKLILPADPIAKHNHPAPLTAHSAHHHPSPNLTFQPDITLKHMLEGRRLLLDEALDRFTLTHIHDHARNGYIRYNAAMTMTPKPTCLRCGNTDPFLLGKLKCFRCQSECVYCRSCLMMGKVSSCAVLLTWHGPEASEPSVHHGLAWLGTLSSAQQTASDALADHVMALAAEDDFRAPESKPTSADNSVRTRLFSKQAHLPSQKEFLIWAVCGAGKTEMLFQAIHLALQKGWPVMVATPRTDVVLELLPRMQAAFPKTVVTAFHGGTDKEERYSSADLVIATTHQALRFHNHFPLVIIDEVDAFPYSYDEKLKYAVMNARAGKSLTVYVSATPSGEFQRRAENGELFHVKVARRYHGYDLPVPSFRWAGNWSKKLGKGRLPAALLKWLRGHFDNGKQIFLFVPRIDQLDDVIFAVKENVQEDRVESVHASDPDRADKVKAFRRGEIRVLVTTTILERGVTVKGVQVAVLGAEDGIFTESALVQISGRAGRSPDEPIGDVAFFHYGKTKAMVQARRHILLMNMRRDG